MTRKRKADLDLESLRDATSLIRAGYKAVRKKDLTAMNEWNNQLGGYIQREAKRKAERKRKARKLA